LGDSAKEAVEVRESERVSINVNRP
jgi:hypothetical protein